MKHQLHAAALAVLLILIGGTLAPATPADQVPAPAAPAARAPASAGSPRAAADDATPVRLDIPRIGLHTRLIRLGRDPDGTTRLPPPDRDGPAGWPENSAVPGNAGTAVLIGPADPARDGPTVFHRLGRLRPGDEVSVRRSDGVTVQFRVTARRLHRGAPDFSRATGKPSLSLVTCGGNLDPDRRRYRSNLVVLAEPV